MKPHHKRQHLSAEVNKNTRMKAKRSGLVAELKDKTEKCITNRKHANFIVDILHHLQEDEPEDIVACIKSVHRIFSHFIDIEEMSSERTSKGEQTNEVKFRTWLLERYQETVSRLLELLQHDSNNVQEMALNTLLRFIQKESKHPLTSTKSPSTLPIPFLKKVLSQLLDDSVAHHALLTRLQEYLMYDDVRYYTMKHACGTCDKQQRSGDVSNTFLENMFALLDNLSMPVSPVDEPLTNCLSKLKVKDDCMTKLSEHKRQFSLAWTKFLQFKLPSSLYRKVLISLHDRVIPHMTNPLVLSDFLTVSYNIGGGISLLSLNSLFILIHKHNLHYPDFFTKLYALFEPTIFHAKYRSRFFFLSNLFLSSTHMPAYVVAAFAKRLARIALTAPVVALKIVIPFIYNLINRHPICKQMIDRPDRESETMDDPYLPEEVDPAKCNALDSCLWELKTLQDHYYPEIVFNARKIDHNLPDLETDLSELLDTTADEIFERECSKKIKKAPLTFDPPKGIFGGRDDKLKLCWTL